MTLDALIESQRDRRYTATLLAWPTYQAHGTTEAEAVACLRASLSARLAEGKIVQRDVPGVSAGNPWRDRRATFRQPAAR